MSKSVKMLTRSGIIASLYVVLSLLCMPLASGAIQVRFSECLTVLPLFFIEAIPALFIGCIVTNIITGCVVLDIIVGSVTTLLSAILTYFVGRKIKKDIFRVLAGGIFPILLNAFILPIVWIFYSLSTEYIYIIQVLILICGQTISVYALGIPLYFAIKRIKIK